MEFSVKSMQNRGNSEQKEVTNQGFLLVNDQRNSQMANQMQALEWVAQNLDTLKICKRIDEEF